MKGKISTEQPSTKRVLLVKHSAMPPQQPDGELNAGIAESGQLLNRHLTSFGTGLRHLWCFGMINSSARLLW